MQSFWLLIVFLGCALCIPQDTRKELPTEKSTALTNSELADLNSGVKDHKEIQPVKGNVHKEGFQDNASFGFIQTVRKEWKCENGRCTEHITKCKNGRCDSVDNSFKADNYQPDLPKIEPFPFPEINFSELFANLFSSFLKFDFPSPLKFDNSGLMEFIADNSTTEYYFSNAKIINSKCTDRVCAIKTKTCVNDKCDEAITTRSF